MGEEKKSLIKKIQSTGLMRKMMAEYFYSLDRASKDEEREHIEENVREIDMQKHVGPDTPNLETP